MNSLCIFSWRKKNCPWISKSNQRPRPTELVCNQFDTALTSMYTKVLTKWDETNVRYFLTSYLLSYIISHRVSAVLSEVRGGSFPPDSRASAPVFRLRVRLPMKAQTLHSRQIHHNSIGNGGVLFGKRPPLVTLGIAQYCEQELTLYHSFVFLKAFWHDYCIPLVQTHCEKSITWSRLPSDGEQTVLTMICQHRSTYVWVDCAKMTCCIFHFPFLWVYTCCCISKRGLWRSRENVGAKTQSTLFEKP